MKTIFAELYNKILELFQVERAESENTGECAANRLQVILMHDRTKLDPLIMGKMREELIDVFSKYVVIDKEKLEIDLKNEGDAAALMLNIPIVRAKTEEELEELRKKLQEEEEKVSDDEEDKPDEIVEEAPQAGTEPEPADDIIVEEPAEEQQDKDIQQEEEPEKTEENPQNA